MKKPHSNKTISVVFAVLCIIFILICRSHQNTAEWYMQTIYPTIASFLSFISSKIPFSLFDVFIASNILLFIASLVWMIFGTLKFRKWISKVIGTIVALVISFYMLWGIAYFRHDFYERTNVPKANFDTTSFKNFLTHYINQLNDAYIAVNEINYNEIDEAIESSYQKLKTTLHIPYPCGKRPIKRMIFEKWVTQSGVSGYFGPFFNEIHVNRSPLPFEQPYVIAHEKAHQFGIASEAECNLYAYIVCTSSNNAYVRYSGYAEPLGYVLNNARQLLPDEYAEWRSKIKPQIIADYNKSVEHWQQGINTKMAETQRKVYDTYLKTNKIKSGVTNYSEMVALLVSWHNHQFTKN